jgi:hypothetical protein
MLSNIHPSPANHNFLDQYGCAIKRHTAEQYNTYGFLLTKVTECQTAVAYVVVHRKGRKSCSSTFWFSLYSTRSCFTNPVGEGGLSHKHFRTQLIRKLVQNVDMTNTRVHRGRSSSSARHMSRLEAQKFNHWPVNGTKRRFVVCSLRENQSTSSYICRGAASHFVCLRVSRSITRKQTFRRVWNSNE